MELPSFKFVRAVLIEFMELGGTIYNSRRGRPPTPLPAPMLTSANKKLSTQWRES